ncbi:hypothetical protein [Haliangium sp.]|uniref:hypothetical protein n=1 Tax=Haliangium sp. TaxID=2663208 RepID=UPI003D13FB7D
MATTTNTPTKKSASKGVTRARRKRTVRDRIKQNSRTIAEHLRKKKRKKRRSGRATVTELSRAYGMPEDPSRWRIKHCRDVIRHHGDWKEIKQAFQDYPEAMERLVTYRKQAVDEVIAEAKRLYPNIVANSVGSTSLSSDYDITLGTSNGSNEDVEAARHINRRMKEIYGRQPGTALDTNVYVNNFRDMEENVLSGGGSAGGAAPSGQAVAPIAQADMDSLSLLKTRRYMSQVEWDAYTRSVTDSIASPSKQAAAQRQFETADANYHINTAELLAHTGEPRSRVTLTSDEKAWVDAQDESVREMAKQQLLDGKKLAMLDKENPDYLLEKSNELYLRKMDEARRLQGELSQMTDDGRGSLEAVKEEAERQLGNAMFFASEAYHAKGTISHVVDGMQSGNAVAIARMTPNDMLNSFNEQHGDTFKALAHTGDDDGEAFLQSSKYVNRMLDAAQKLKEKSAYGDLAFEQRYGQLADLQQRVGTELEGIRKDPTLTPEERRQRAKAFMNKTFGISTAAELKAMANGLAVEVNAHTRTKVSHLTCRPRQSVAVGGTRDTISRDMDALEPEAQVSQAELTTLTQGIVAAAAPNAEAQLPPGIKSRARAEEKATAWFGGDASKLTDLSRATIACNSMEDVNRVKAYVQENCDVVWVNDRFQEPTRSGYRDLSFNIRASNGHVAELQVHLKAIAEAKAGDGHAIYEQTRVIIETAKQAGRPLTGEERQRLAALEQQSRDLYDSAFTGA